MNIDYKTQLKNQLLPEMSRMIEKAKSENLVFQNTFDSEFFLTPEEMEEENKAGNWIQPGSFILVPKINYIRALFDKTDELIKTLDNKTKLLKRLFNHE